jgi:hypothetical protein
MKLTIDTDAQDFSGETDGKRRQWLLYLGEAFEIILRQRLKLGWN